MHAASLFQSLPPHAVEVIVELVVNSSRQPLKDAETRKSLMPFLWICRNFRAVVYMRFCKTYSLLFSSTTNQICATRSSWPHCLHSIDYPTHLLARELVISVDPHVVFLGHALDMLSRASCRQYVLPLVRSLSIEITAQVPLLREQWEVPTDGLKVEANIGAFTQWIEQMAPKLRTVEWTLNRMSEDSTATVNYVGVLATKLYKLGNRVVHRPDGQRGPAKLQLSAIRHLTHLDYRVYGGPEGRNDYQQAFQLARQNALTLKSLVIRLLPYYDISDLIVEANGKYVAYPCLHTLELRQQKSTSMSAQQGFNGAVPFPFLRRLHIEASYPFRDDTPFRGNAATLEYLKVMVRSQTAAMLKDRNVFTPTSHPKLNCVKLGQITPSVRDQFASASAYMHFALSIAPSALLREINHLGSPTGGVASALALCADCSCIRVLSLPSTFLLFYSAIDVIKLLPLLTELHVQSLGLGLPPANVELDELPTYVISNYAPMGYRLRFFHLASFIEDSLSDTVRSVLLLALLCPIFDIVVTCEDSRAAFYEQMEYIINSEPFQPYPERLQRLLANSQHVR